MGYDWGKSAEGGQNAEKIPAGEHKVNIAKVVFGSKANGKFESESGDPQIMLIFADAEAREVSQMVTLSEKAGWVLSQILKAAGANLDKMTASGITPDRFADETFANAQLLGRTLTIEVKYNKKGYADIKPLRAREDATVPADDDDIPV